jgi:DNA-binding PadR family transcriptional regulator
MVDTVRGQPQPGRLIGIYALSVMDSDGPLYGYMLSERIADRTGGAWRPGAGAVYPALDALTRRRLARRSTDGRRRVYQITAQGRALLRQIRRNMAWRNREAPDLSRLWSEIAGSADPTQYLLENFRRNLERLVGHFAPGSVDDRHRRAQREELRATLRLADARLGNGDARARSRRPPSRRASP